MPKTEVLLVDDEPQIRSTLRRFLESRGYQILEADSCQAALKISEESQPDAMVLDYSMPDGDALQLLPPLQEAHPGVPIIVLTAYATVELAVQAMKLGAEHFLTKPVDLTTLHHILDRALENQRNRLKVAANESRLGREFLNTFLGSGPAITELAKLTENAVRTDLPVLIQGETGAGKGMLAMWLHHHSPRAREAFVDLNCAGLSRELLESELFGHEKGAFTGAVTTKMGLLEIAHRGTIFLDEIGDADLMVQAKLLKVLEERRFRRLGEVRDTHVDIRLVAATHHNLRELIAQKKFRDDLYFRISTIILKMPPLRERREDIALLAKSLLHKTALNLKHSPIELTPEAVAALESYSWPGNIRELRNVLERAALLSNNGKITRQHLSFEFTTPEPRTETTVQTWTVQNTRMRLSDVEKMYIQKVIQEENGSVERAAERLGVPRSSLYKRIKASGILVAKASA